MPTDPASVSEAPAVELLSRLVDHGFDLTVHEGRLRVAPGDRLTAALEAEIRASRDELMRQVRLGDPGVQERLAAFTSQRPSTAPVLVADVRYVAGACFSCADRLAPDQFGRCWRCAQALRLAWHLPMSNNALLQGGDECESVSQSSSQAPRPRPVPRDQTLEPFTRPTPTRAAMPAAK